MKWYINYITCGKNLFLIVIIKHGFGIITWNEIYIIVSNSYNI